MDATISGFAKLIATVRQLRSEHGCPWDKRQTTASLVKHLEEEFQEIMAAIDAHDTDNLCEELGDFLYLIVMVAEINRQEGFFSLQQVIDSIDRKLIRRHPHVFGDTQISDESTLRRQWQEIKRSEKAGRK